MTALFGPQNANAALVLPNGSTLQRYGTAQTWVQDCSAPGRNDGTVLDASFYNRIIGNLDYIVSIANVAATPGDMSALYRAIMAAVAGSAPQVLDTIAELAAALGTDANFSTTMATALANRLRFDMAQSLTTLQRQQAALNLGLLPIVFSGSYSDLSGVPSLGTAAALDWGTSASQLIRLDNTGKIPALDGSQLTALPLVPTAALGTNTQQIANTAFVAAALAALVNSSPGTLDTLKELADALGDDPNFSTTITTLVGAKLAKASNLSDLANVVTARTNLGLGSGALYNVGTGASQVVQLDGTGKLPAVDGSQLTNVVGTGAVRYDTAQALTAAQLTQARLNLSVNQDTQLAASQNLNLVTAPGTYYTPDTASTNGPTGVADFLFVEVQNMFPLYTGALLQRITCLQSDQIYMRRSVGNAWQPWVRVTIGAPGQLLGTATNDSAAAGKVGEFVSSSVLLGNAVALTTNTPTNLTSVYLTPGDWDISCQMYFLPAVSTVIQIGVNSISLVSATGDYGPGNFGEQSYGSAGMNLGAANFNVNAGPRQLSIASAGNVYAVALAGFTTSTMGVYGILRARRMR